MKSIASLDTPSLRWEWWKKSTKQKEAEEAIYQALHHQFVASSLATKYAHQIIPNAQVGCMVTRALAYPLTSNPVDVMLAQQHNRENYFFLMCRFWNVSDFCQKLLAREQFFH